MTGPIPEEALQKLLQAELRKDQLARGVRKAARRDHWYTRYDMWQMAMRLFGPEGSQPSARQLDSLDDLEPWEYERGLQEVNDYLKDHCALRSKGKVVRVARDAGPNSVEERYDDCAAYNGEGGGQHFSWFLRRIFRAVLVELGTYDMENVTEAVCMEALARTSARVWGTYKCLKSHLVPYAGPQCFPQLVDDVRGRANERFDPVRSGEVVVDVAEEVLEQMVKCWLQCRICGKWRLIDRMGLASLSSQRFAG